MNCILRSTDRKKKYRLESVPKELAKKIYISAYQANKEFQTKDTRYKKDLESILKYILGLSKFTETKDILTKPSDINYKLKPKLAPI